MSELFKNDEMNGLFFGITLTAKQESMIVELVKMNQEVIGSKVFGYVLYDNGTFPIMTNIDRDFFAENYIVILTAMSQAGVYDSYSFLIKQVLGRGTHIQYSSLKPRHLIITISNIDRYETKLTTATKQWLTTDLNLGLVETRTIPEFTVNQLKKVLKILANPSGTYLDVIFGELHEKCLTGKGND